MALERETPDCHGGIAVMSQAERMLVSAIFVILLGFVSWLLATVSINTGRIMVLEQRTNNHAAEMQLSREELKEHRKSTENGKH